MPSGSRISGHIVRADFNAVEAVVHYTRAAHRLGLWESERLLIERFFPDKTAALLEAGCGAGRATLGLWELGYRALTAFDFAEELVDQARDLATQRGATGIRFLNADATKPSQVRALLTVPCSAARERSDSDSPSVVAGRRSRSASVLGAARENGDASAPLRPSSVLRPQSSVVSSSSTVCRLPSVVCPPPPSALSSRASHRAPLFAGALFLFNGLMQIPTRRARRAALRNIAAVLQPGAPFLFTTHDRDEPDELHLWRAEAKRWAAGTQDPRLHEYGDRYFVHEHGRTFMHLPSRNEMLAELVATGWSHEYDIMRNDLARESHAVRDFSDNCRFWLVRTPCA
jgi:SAM-dependent methyltransferase